MAVASGAERLGPTPDQRVRDWFAAQGWTPFAFQRQAWAAYQRGHSGLIHASTGTGKTLAAWIGPLREALAEAPVLEAPPLRVLWVTPLRALANDTAAALARPVTDLELNWTLETRTGDTTAAVRNRQRRRLPTALITTPESLTLLLSREEAREQLVGLKAVVVDEWHELLGSKRGVQLELALARLRRWRPRLRVWGLSATLGNLDEAARVLIPHTTPRLLRGAAAKPLHIDAIIPPNLERFPWAGHLGVRLLPEVIAEIDAAATTLVFTNTRAQTEIWYQALLQARPDWAGLIALHHGSLDLTTRRWVEAGLQAGTLKAVVCTSTLDLGVDFGPVERVLQIGSAKGVARLVQRAGRSGHRPGAASRVTCVPTHAFELVEVAAVRTALARGCLEPRPPLQAPLDVLAQHAVTLALAGGYTREEFAAEVRATFAFAAVTDAEIDWVLDFVTTGGPTLRAYPDYQKVVVRDGQYRVDRPALAKRHRLAIGTILGDASLTVRFLRGSKLGTIEESFVSRLQPGDRFLFAGRLLELAFLRDGEVLVRKASGSAPAKVPRWMGGRMPLSSELAHAVQEALAGTTASAAAHPGASAPAEECELAALRPLLELQARWSAVPGPNDLLVEQVASREGHHTFIYPFAGRLVHEGLAALFAWRLAQRRPLSFSMSVNDYGMELLAPTTPHLAEALLDGLFDTANLADDIARCLNSVEMGKRQFREIARIAGLVYQGYPGQPRSSKHLQASASLIYDVFREYDPDNRLLRQAWAEVLERQLEFTRLRTTLEQMQRRRLLRHACPRFTPLAFPLMIDRLRDRLSSEKLADRIRRLQQQLEKAAGC